MLMLRAGPRDGKRERRRAKANPDNHRRRPPPIDPVPRISQESPHAELLTDSRSEASGAASKAARAAAIHRTREPRGGAAVAECGRGRRDPFPASGGGR